MKVRLLVFLLALAPVALSAQKMVQGTVVDLFTGQPIESVTIMAKGTMKGTSTDAEGRFNLLSLRESRQAKIVVSAIGYETKTITASASKNPGQVIYLKPAAHELKPVVIIGYPPVCSRRIMAPTVTGAKIEKTVNTPLKQFLCSVRWCLYHVTMEPIATAKVTGTPQKVSVKVYPNPIVAGNSIQAAMQLEEGDQYHFDLIDAGGRVIWMKKLNVTSTQYNLTIPTQSTLSAGVYWLRVIGKDPQRIYNGKIVVQ